MPEPSLNVQPGGDSRPGPQRRAPNSGSVGRCFRILLPALLTVGVFLLDLRLPLGYAAWLFYVIPVLLVAWWHGRGVTLAFAALCSGLVLLDLRFGRPMTDQSVLIANSVTAIVALWILVVALLRGKQAAARAEHLAVLPDLNPFPVAEVDAEGRVTYINPVAKRLFPELASAGVAHPWLSDLLETISQARQQDEDSVTRELLVDGRTYQQVILDARRECCFRVFGVDISELKQAERTLRSNETQLRRSNDLLEAVTSGSEVIVAAVDADLRYLFFNQAYREEIKRLTSQSLEIGSTMAEVFAHLPEQRDVALQQWRRTLQGTAAAYQIDFGDPGTYRRTYNVRHTPIRDPSGNVIGAGEIAFEVTEKVQAEAEIRRRVGELHAANEELERFNRVAVGRELRMFELKQEVNELCRQAGLPPRYAVEAEAKSGAANRPGP